MTYQHTLSTPKQWALSIAKVIRILTVPPVMTALLPLVLRLKRGAFPGASLGLTILFLSILPTLSYAVWAIIPSLRAQDRNIQRKMAVLFSVAGYVAGTIYCFYAGLGRIERIVYLTYFLSGTIIALLSFCLHLKSSGMAGPLLMLGLEVNPWFFLGFMLLGIVFWSSLCLRRHTAGELLLRAGTTMGIILLLQQIL